MKAYSTREIRRILKNNGYEYIGCRGDHFKYRKADNTVVVNKNINKMVARRIIKENKLTV